MLFASASTNPAKEDVLLMRILRLLVNIKQNWGHVKSIALCRKLAILSLLKTLGQPSTLYCFHLLKILASNSWTLDLVNILKSNVLEKLLTYLFPLLRLLPSCVQTQFVASAGTWQRSKVYWCGCLPGSNRCTLLSTLNVSLDARCVLPEQQCWQNWLKKLITVVLGAQHGV